MRTKKLPFHLPHRDCTRRTFYFHSKCAELNDTECIFKPKRKTSKVCNVEQKELYAAYPHCISLANEKAPTDRLLQTITIPINYFPCLPPGTCKLSLFFNSQSFLIYWRESETSKQFVVTDGGGVIPFLFAASSNCLEVYYQGSNLAMQLHVCYKLQSVHSSEDLLERANTCQQYEKISDFVTLLKPEMTTSLKNHKIFVFERYCENQPEFIQLIQGLYKFVQHTHMHCNHLWKDQLLDFGNVVTTLRPYQSDAVKWMFYRESNLIELNTLELFKLMYIPIDLPGAGKKLYFTNHCGFFVDRIPQFKPPSLGGILADEMGLGKTLEVISLVLAHPWPNWDRLGGRLYTLDGHAVECSDNSVLSGADDCRVLCCCGGEAVETKSCDLVRCSRCCGPMQHAVCVQYENAEDFMLKLPNKHAYICPECWSQIRIDSKATLVVAPDHIWQQWKEELQSHLSQGSTKVLVYAGMEAPVTEVEVGVGCAPTNLPGSSQRATRGQSLPTTVNPFSPRTLVSAGGDPAGSDMLFPGFVQPGQLAAADVVLTAFSVVQRELGWAEVTAERRAGLGQRPQLRLAQRYLCRPSPLTCVRWWRLCLDEAQMVERVTSKTARMLFQIEAVNRWCITGTPAEKSIDDLFGMFVFLRYEPFSIPLYWQSLLYQPFLSDTTVSRSEEAGTATPTVVSASPDGVCDNGVKSVRHSAVGQTLLAKVLAEMLWRNTKELVGDQLSLPPITEEIHWINFTPVERYIHDRVLAQSSGALNRLLGQFSPDRLLASLSGNAHWRLVYLITRLRQVCTHASLVVAAGGGGEAVGCGDRRGRGNANPLRQSHQEPGDSDDSGDLLPPPSRSRSMGPNCGEPSPSAARSLRHLGTGCFTMTEVLRRVVDETRRECEGLLRSWIFNKNGSASCYIIKQQYADAADCYRDVLRVAASLETRHGILADCSQHLHAITNLHWLIQAHQVSLAEEGDSGSGEALAVLRHPPNRLSRTHRPVDETAVSLDPRVDRDLVAKAERLRLSYIQKHSHLLAKVHESLDPIVLDLNTELGNPVATATHDNTSAPLVETKSSPSELVWLDWLAEAVDWLATRGVDGSSLAGMLMASFQGRPLGNRCHYRTTLLHLSDVGSNSFKARLLYELADVFKTRRQLHKAMQPLTSTWKSFQAGMAVNRDILEAFYACCARADQPEPEEGFDAALSSGRKKKKKETSLSELTVGDRPKSSRSVQRKCAYCIAVKALRCYQCAVNHEKPTRASSTKNSWSDRTASSLDGLDIGEKQTSTEVEQVLTASGVMLGNPLVVGLSIVCHQVVRCLAQGGDGVPVASWRQRARRLDQLIRQMGKEILVDAQLQSYIVEAQVTWPELQSRLAHFTFLRNAHMTTAAGASQGSPQLECPTCLQVHSPSNPTFALLPGCWHTLCLPCHDRIANSAKVGQRRCPICRTPLIPMGSSGSQHAHRRRPLTLIHYAGDEQREPVAALATGEDGQSALPVVGDHSSKVQTVIRCLKQIKQEDPDAKVIVFSSWISVLITLAGALEENDLVYTTFLRARDACQPGRLTGFQFRGSANWILLMPIQLGANGLNLTSANHVFLVDPVLSHGREAQAIARMHRIGQSRPSVVHRFLVRDSIEAALHAAHCRSGLSNTGCCMVGGGARRTSSTALGVAGPGEDRAQLMQMTVGELADLLRMETGSNVAETSAS